MDVRENIIFNDLNIINFINLNSNEKEMIRNWRNQDSIRIWMFNDHIISQEEHAKYFDRIKNDTKNYFWIVKNNKEDYIGVVSINNIDHVNKNGFLGIYVNPFLNLKGAGFLLIGCLKWLAFNYFDLHSLKLQVIENNEKAINFYSKAGFSEEGKLREFIFKNNKWLDVIIMGIINTGKI